MWMPPIDRYRQERARLAPCPGGLRYRAPDAAAATRWTFDARRGRYEHRDDPARQPTASAPSA